MNIVERCVGTPELTEINAQYFGSYVFFIVRPRSQLLKMDGEMMAVFGPVLAEQQKLFKTTLAEDLSATRPNKTPKTSNNGKGQGRKDNKNWPDSSQGQPATRKHADTAVVRALARAVIRQDTQLQIMKQDTSWVFFMSPEGPLPLLCQVATKWKEQASQHLVKSPLRATLLSCLFTSLSTFLETIQKSKQEQAQVENRGWLRNGLWVYQRWNKEAQCLQIDEGREGLSQAQLITDLQGLSTLIMREGMINRFHATKPVVPQPEGQTVFLLEVSLRCQDFAQVWQALEKLSGLAALQVIGLQIRKEGLRKSPMMDNIQRLLGSQD